MAASVTNIGEKAIEYGFVQPFKLAATYAPVVAAKGGEFYKNTVDGALRKVITRSDNPVLTGCAVAGATGALFIAAPAVVSAPLLAGTGFTASGVQATSIGAAIHGTIGNVAAGSCFAIFQSAGAGGAAALGVINGAIQASGAAMGLISGGVAYFTRS